MRLQFAGSVLFAVTESGVAAYSVATDLVADSEDPHDKARRLAAAGDLEGAFAELGAILSGQRAGSRRSASEVGSFYVRMAGEVAQLRRRQSGVRAGVEVLEQASRTLREASLPVDSRLVLFRIECLDPKVDAREIRVLREELADLSLAVGPESDVPDAREER